MPSYDPGILLAMLKRQEGVVDHLYPDPLDPSLGTWGMGHNENVPIPHEAVKLIVRACPQIPQQAIDIVAANDIAQAAKDVAMLGSLRGVSFEALSPNRQMALVDMCFNLGSDRLGHFVKMWEALRKMDYQEAAAQALDSQWARQVGSRAQELAAMIRDG